MNSLYENISTTIKLIPLGRVSTINEIAKFCGASNSKKYMASLIKKNPDVNNIPTYRVVDAKGKIPQHLIKGGRRKQKRLLINEGVEVKKYYVDLDKYGFIFW